MSSPGQFIGTDSEFSAVLTELPIEFTHGHALHRGQAAYERLVYKLADGTKLTWYNSTRGGMNFQGVRHAQLREAFMRAHQVVMNRSDAVLALPPAAVPTPTLLAAAMGASAAVDAASSYCGHCGHPRAKAEHVYCSQCGHKL